MSTWRRWNTSVRICVRWNAISASYDDGARSFTGRKQSGRILMDYTCRHRLLRGHGSSISPIIVYAWSVNIMFYRRIPARELARWAPLSVLFHGTRFEKSTYSSVSRRRVSNHLRGTRESYDRISFDSFPSSLFFYSSRTVVGTLSLTFAQI